MLNSPRYIAYLALLKAFQGEEFISSFLDRWKEPISSLDRQLIKQLAFGTCQRALTLEYFAKELSSKKTLKVSLKQKTLLLLGLYQIAFLDRIPAYAAVNAMVELAKKEEGSHFAKFLNAILRKAATALPPLPEDFSIRYSYPQDFVDLLLAQVGKEKIGEILELGNLPAALTFRVRGEKGEGNSLEELVKDPSVYIQNKTPLILMEALRRKDFTPKRILDLCASPGGKLLIAHDFFPQAALFANDVSEKKLSPLRENLQKYGVQATLSCGAGEAFQSDEHFDLIICDVPCSNSGVLNKRPEARWRLSKEAVLQHAELQKKLLGAARELLAPGGEIWYMTCSILQEENEGVCSSSGMRMRLMQTQYPTADGLDGGFSAALF